MAPPLRPGDPVFIAARAGGPRESARFSLVRNWVEELVAKAEANVRRAEPSTN